MPSPASEAWVRLGEMLVRRRLELDPRYRNRRTFASERAPKLYRIINDIELGKRPNYEPSTLAAIESAYQLEPGAIRRFLADDGDLAPSPAAPVPLRQDPDPDMPSDLPVSLRKVAALFREFHIGFVLEQAEGKPLRDDYEADVMADTALPLSDRWAIVGWWRWVQAGRPGLAEAEAEAGSRLTGTGNGMVTGGT